MHSASWRGFEAMGGAGLEPATPCLYGAGGLLLSAAACSFHDVSIVRRLDSARCVHAHELAKLGTMSNWYAHELGIFDHWSGWTVYDPTRPDSVDRTSGEDSSIADDPGFLEDLLRQMHKEAVERFKGLGWEGDGRWYYSGFITGRTAGPELLLAVKQANNGTVYVLAPIALPIPV